MSWYVLVVHTFAANLCEVENTVKQLLYMAGDKTVRGAFSCPTGFPQVILSSMKTMGKP